MNKSHRIGPIIGFLVVIWLISIAASSFFSTSNADIGSANAAVIRVYGTIRSTGADSAFFDGAISNDIITLLDKADKDPRVKAIVLDINSGGGSAVGSDEIGQKLKSINKTTVAWVREVGASGAYWIASSTDHIVANRMSLVGSIGVIGSYLEFAELLDDYNVTYRRLVAGKFKDAGSPFKELTPDEEGMLQNLIDELFEVFVNEVADNRNLPVSKVRGLATGEVFSGTKGVELGLIDETGGLEEVRSYIEKELNTTVRFRTLQKEETIADILRKIISEQSFNVGAGIGSFINKQGPLIKT